MQHLTRRNRETELQLVQYKQARLRSVILHTITKMLKICGIEILEGCGYSCIQDGHYFAIARGESEQITKKFDAAFPQCAGALNFAIYSGMSDEIRCRFYLDYLVLCE